MTRREREDQVLLDAECAVDGHDVVDLMTASADTPVLRICQRCGERISRTP